jgi:hypothetical protein
VRFIPTPVHGMMDYAWGVLLIAAPYVLGFADGGVAQWVASGFGLAAIIQSLFTDYELAVLRLIPLRVHLGADVAMGVLLAASPFLLGFSDRVWVPHAVFGVTSALAGLMTRTATSEGAGLERNAGWPLTGSPMSAMPRADRAATADGRPGGQGGTPEAGNVSQLRHAINSGSTGEKVAMVDPAMAPLGTDNEASGLHDHEGLRVARERGGRSRG